MMLAVAPLRRRIVWNRYSCLLVRNTDVAVNLTDGIGARFRDEVLPRRRPALFWRKHHENPGVAAFRKVLAAA